MGKFQIDFLLCNVVSLRPDGGGEAPAGGGLQETATKAMEPWEEEVNES